MTISEIAKIAVIQQAGMGNHITLEQAQELIKERQSLGPSPTQSQLRLLAAKIRYAGGRHGNAGGAA